MIKLIAVFVSSLLLTNLVKAQSGINDVIDSYVGENAVPYVQPLADVFTSNINTGVWDWASIDKDFYVRLKLQGMVSFPSESMMTFEGRTTGNFRPEQSIVVPSILGERDAIILEGNANSTYIFPGGFDMDRVLLGTPQITIGGFLNSEVTARFLAFPMGEDLDNVRFYGIGARHSISNYFTNSPVDLSVGYMYHHTQADQYLDSDQHLLSAHLGKSGKIFSGQLMLGYQASDSDIHYIYDEGGVNETEVNLNLQNQNPFIMEAGMGAKLGPVMANASISYSEHIAAALGIGLSF